MTALFIRTIAVVSCSVVGAAAVAGETVLMSTDFENDVVGPLGAPWSVFGDGGSTVSVVDVAGRHGHVMQLDGDGSLGSFVTASSGFSASQRRAVAKFDVRPSQGGSFVWSLTGPGSYSRVRLQLAPGTGVLDAQTSPSGDTICGALPAGKWTSVTLSVDARRDTHTFDVLLDGQATACTGIVTDLGPPFEDVGVMDASNSGWGGRVQFDNFVVKVR